MDKKHGLRELLQKRDAGSAGIGKCFGEAGASEERRVLVETVGVGTAEEGRGDDLIGGFDDPIDQAACVSFIADIRIESHLDGARL